MKNKNIPAPRGEVLPLRAGHQGVFVRQGVGSADTKHNSPAVSLPPASSSLQRGEQAARYSQPISNKVILDTDIGYDPDDLFALLLAWRLPEFDIDLIVTADEEGGKRAVFTKMILDKLGLTKPKVVEGSDLGNKNFIVDELIQGYSYDVRKDYIRAMKELIDLSSGQTLYIGIGGFTNLASFLKQHPEYNEKLKIYMMGGAINYSRGKDWVEHNIRIDAPSAKYVLESGCDITLVMAQTTFIDEYEVTNTHPIFQKLKSSKNEAYQLLAQHCELFNEHMKDKYGREIWPKMHDPLTLVSAMGKDFVKFHKSLVSIDRDGKMSISNTGQDIRWSDPVSAHEEFMALLEERLFDRS